MNFQTNDFYFLCYSINLSKSFQSFERVKDMRIKVENAFEIVFICLRVTFKLGNFYLSIN